MLKNKIYIKILLAILVGIIAGYLSGKTGNIFGLHFYSLYVFLGQLFMNALKMMIVPLILTSIITAVSNLSSASILARLGSKSFYYYILTSFIAIVIGITLVLLFKPGYVNGQPVQQLLGLPAPPQTLLTHLQSHGVSDMLDIFLRMFPANIVQAAANGEMLGMIVFSLLFGFFITKLPKVERDVMQNFWQAANHVIQSMILLILWFAPFGIFGLVAKVIADTGFAAFAPMLRFFLIVLAGLAIHAVIVLPTLLYFLAKQNPLRYIKIVAPALLTAFSSASSSGTLPITMETLLSRTKLSPTAIKFILPLGATINMDGTALYECVAALFLVQAYGIKLSFLKALLVLILALLTSIGVAGVPAASLVAIGVILTAVGLPLEAIGILLITDRILDMFRTAVNVWSDTCCTAIVSRYYK